MFSEVMQMSQAQESLDQVKRRIAAACDVAGRAHAGVQLLAVSKTFPAQAVFDMVAAGQRAFGENYVQEGVEKIAQVKELTQNSPPLEWHFIGPLQSNKTRLVAEHFDWVHSVDRLKIAQRLSEQRPADLPALQVCIQVNISGEDSKSGVNPSDVPALAQAIQQLPGVKLRGLMAIPEPCDDPQLARQPFRAMQTLLNTMNEGGMALDTLSMGMSGDMEAAIAEGATIVRVGTALFGHRTYPAS